MGETMTQETVGAAARLGDGTEKAAAGRRLVEVDALRGFALGGILLVNVLVMAGPYGAIGADPREGGADLVAHWLVVAFAEGKFYLLFSFLFGYSFTLQMSSAVRAGARFTPRMLRRLLGLFVIGALHATLLYTGDILMTYALLGLILFAARNTSVARARRAALWLYGAVSALLLLAGLGMLLADDPTSEAELRAQVAELTAAYRGDAADVIGANLRALPEALAAVLLVGGLVVAAFLAGFAAGKGQLLSGTAERRGRLRRMCVIGLAVGLPGAVVMAAGTVGPLSDRWELLSYAVGIATAPALSLAYAAGLLLWFGTPRGARTAARLAPAGRMALTNYLLQSLVMALVFTGYGLGLYGRVGTAATVCGALVLYGAQLWAGGRLLRRCRLGPVEWVLRALTVGGRPSNVRDTGHAART
ncbi:DUF418 domain-containing protein [Streptomyces lunaelactis]|nr:DUF418 domain-containing protein [Streptomyces lunaelactis]NUK09446.1 DUF418 domain-containing protein [Streptomyces lunaelactis]NUK16539.1 DUF418 domain-containing protein [Streptomyces lunaelactis]NUK35548.1 DUF418 domain-containing protein [Streptomyces lunaelactis]NUK42444.1 DUF418 domain-containing protein [Streptomyces lunaelactis]